jgi:surface polysaccharide O-acyltransferase-like enzyme
MPAQSNIGSSSMPASFKAQVDQERLFFVDALRTCAIMFVIVHHAAQAYGPTGGFWPVHDQAQSGWFAPFYTANAAFGMGLMFLLAGYFVPASCDQKGPLRFLQARTLRIGIPLASIVLLVHLPAAYLVSGHPAPATFVHGLYERGWQPIYLHLWFVADLLLYSAAYAAWRHLGTAKLPAPRPSLPGHAVIAVFIVALALVTFIVRIRYPVDKWVPLLWIMPAEPAHLPQYVALFVAGIVAYRGDWFRNMPVRAGLLWLAIGLIASAAIYLAYATGSWRGLMAQGGFSSASLWRSILETIIAVSLCIGLIVAFREMCFRSSRLRTLLAAASFGAYILHPAIVVALQAAILSVALPAFAKFALVSVLGIMLAFGAAHLGGKVPGLRAVLGAAGLGSPKLSAA